MECAADKVLQFGGSILVVALSALFWVGGASQMVARAASFQSGTLARPASAQTAGPGVATASAEADPLRRRAEDFYALLQLGRWDQAEGFVSQDSREIFHNAQKSGFLGFKVGSVEIAPDGADATVEVTMQIVTANIAAPGPISVPQKSHWRRVDGVWYMVVPPPANAGAQLGNLFTGSAPKGQAPPQAEDLKFKGHTYTLGRIGKDEVKTARFPFTNVTNHVVTLTSVFTGCDCLQVKLTKKEFKPGESGDLEVQFNPKGFELEYTQTMVVKTDPGDLTTYLTVAAYVLPPALHPQVQGSKGHRPKTKPPVAAPTVQPGSGAGSGPGKE